MWGDAYGNRLGPCSWWTNHIWVWVGTIDVEVRKRCVWLWWSLAWVCRRLWCWTYIGVGDHRTTPWWGGAWEVERLRWSTRSWLMEDMLLPESKRTSCGLLRIVAMAVHTGELEDVDACMCGGCAPFNTPRLSFPTGRSGNYCQPTVLAHFAYVFGCSISDNVSSRAHSCCKKKHLGLPCASRVGRFLLACSWAFWISISIGVALLLYCFSELTLDDQLIWSSVCVVASMRCAMRMASWNVLGPWLRTQRYISGRSRGHKKNSFIDSGIVEFAWVSNCCNLIANCVTGSCCCFIVSSCLQGRLS